jgi:hypothetical protein
MQIRPAHIDAMSPPLESRFLDRVVQFVIDEIGAEEVPTIRTTCQQLISRARTAGFSTEFEIVAFVACGCVFGVDFDSNRDILCGSILRDPNSDAQSKAEQLATMLDRREL